MASTPLIMGETQRAMLTDLRDRASRQPVAMEGLAERLKTLEGKRAHMDQMNAQTVTVPIEFLVTYSVETGHPIGTCRHMSMSSPRPGRMPAPEAVQWIAEALGFVGDIIHDGSTHIWIEDLQRGDGRAKAINVLQPLTVVGVVKDAIRTIRKGDLS